MRMRTAKWLEIIKKSQIGVLNEDKFVFIISIKMIFATSNYLHYWCSWLIQLAIYLIFKTIKIFNLDKIKINKIE